MQVYVDNGLAFQKSASSLNDPVAITNGTHTVVVQSWDTQGNYAKSGNISINVSGAAPAPPPSSGIGVSSPTAGATTASPVLVVASASMSYPVTVMQVYADGALVLQKNAASLNDPIAVANGAHTINVQSWDSQGNYAKSGGIPINVTGSTSGGLTAPSNATYYTNIDQMSGWQNCGACAGPGGTGPTVAFSETQNVSSPSMDGKAAHFWIGGATPYADALWWKQLGANPNTSHFIYDLYFYYTNASAPQALEFDANQSVGGLKYIFGTECNVAINQWDVWNTAGAAWVHTGIACPAPPTYTWNHLVWEFERVNGQTHFVSVTLNGTTSYVNRYFNAQASGAAELNVAFQMDENSKAANYDVWLDKVNLTAW
jgi:hypothetical protein